FVRWKAREVGQQLDQLPVQPWLVSLSAPRSILSHFLYFFLPFRWAYYTTYNTSPVPFIAMTAAGLAAAGSCIFWLWRSRLRPGPALFFLLFAVVALLPASNLLPLGNNWFGVRYLTHAGVGLALLLGHAVFRIGLVRPDLRRALRLSLLVWLIAAAVQSNRFHILWRTEETFFTTMIGVNDNRLLNEALAKLRRRQGQFSEAEALARHAIELDPESIGPRMTLGIALQRQNRLDEAVAEWRAVEALEPGNVDMAVSLATYYYEPLYQRTRDPGDLEKADRYYRIGCTGATPNAEIAYNNRGRLWAVEGNLEKAIGIWNEGLLKFPGSLSIGPNLERANRELADRQAGETPPP
ncbi:hypothetical protein IIC65_05495, partial [Candidatus Sumerlaeota bacterium]|nr:hypothetical protein [Candidatus Sumerlaeota bacterium]